MDEEVVKLIIGALLHDIGKVIYRQGQVHGRHSEIGYEFLKNNLKYRDKEIMESVRYHHGNELSKAKIDDNSMAYITYIADNIAAAADRRNRDEAEFGYDKATPLEPVFNILNGNKAKMYYPPAVLKNETIINPQEDVGKYDTSFYNQVMANLTDNLRGLEWSGEYVNSLLEVLEANLSFIPSSTAKGEVADISLYDHLKLTAAFATNIYYYLKYIDENNEKVDYRERLYKNTNTFYDEKAFLLFSMDISGIQKFIYTITSKNALKNLRARSFYLEIMMEHIIDTLLNELGLSRTNLLYSGGGHCYLLLPNTQETLDCIKNIESRLNKWLLEKYDISLYVASGYVPCSANELQNKPDGCYSTLFRTISQILSEKKMKRYGADDILYLNHMHRGTGERECKVCKKVTKLSENDLCDNCENIMKFSKNILYTEFFTITSKASENSVELPFDAYLVGESTESLKSHMNQSDFIRTYGKNKMYTGKHIATKLWVGNYTTGETMEKLASKSKGISRIGILRADVDNLGQTIVSGFENKENHNRYVTLSRTSTLSRQLSLFFKLYINDILSNPKYTIDHSNKKERNATIVYSGGDDVFVVGAWDDIVEAAVDIHYALKKFTEGTLSISGGIGFYHDKYPIHVSAYEVADLEDESKRISGKDAVTILPDGATHIETDGDIMLQISDGTYHWDEFVERVIEEKYEVIVNFFSNSDERGKNFLYNLLELIRNCDEDGDDKPINFARYVYLLARMEPRITSDENVKRNYREFSKKMYEWIKSDRDRRELKTAITMYVYSIREEEE